jgi:hypothetical protein
LHRAGILTTENCNIIVGHPDPRGVADALISLHKVGILTSENRNVVAAEHPSPYLVADALTHLHRAHILTPENRNVVAAGHANSGHVARALTCLHYASILTPENRTVVVAWNARPVDVADALTLLYKDGILTQDNFNTVGGHANSADVTLAISCLHRAGILTQDYFNVVAGHADPRAVADALIWLHKAGILTPENRDVVVWHASPLDVTLALFSLNHAHILTQENFTALLSPAHQVLLNPNMREIMWNRLGPTQLRDNWVRILEAVRHANPVQALTILTDQILGIEPVAGANPVNAQINDQQSTHTASVHCSVSESATRLFERYGAQLDGLNLDTIIATINAWAHALPAGNVNDAAKRCVERLSAPHYTYSDAVSDVSTRQLLALSWLAIHDEAHRQGSLSDALRQFCEGLYESQRGYNLSDEWVDEGGVDNPICTAGTFNKLVEKLAGIHPDVIIKHITSKIAGLKFPSVVKEEVNRYLTERTKPTTAAGFVSITARLKQIEDEGVSAVWDAIKENVSTRMFEEFGSLYTNKDNPQFTGLVDAGQYVNLGQLLSESEGYREYCSVSMKSYGVFFKISREVPCHRDDKNNDAPTP